MIGPISVRPFDPRDAAEADALLRTAFADHMAFSPEAVSAVAAGTMNLSQAGSRILVAESGNVLRGVVRWWEEEGIAWTGLLASRLPGAGRRLLQAVEREAQDGGLRLLRASIPDDGRLADYFARRGYLPIARLPRGLLVEKRLPLLTVREQRRSDAAAIALLTGEDPWPFEQGPRPGWFVLADGDRVGGVVAARQARDGTATIVQLVVGAGYEGRGLEAWMLDRAALWAETAGCHTVLAPATPALDRLAQRLEASRWFPAGAMYRRTL